jgi:hypothetical protein
MQMDADLNVFFNLRPFVFSKGLSYFNPEGLPLGRK